MAKILVVEDEQSLLGEVVDWLKDQNHTVEGVTSGSDAMHLLTVCKYDAVVLDLELPGASGLQVLRQFRSTGGKTPVLILTGKAAVAEKEEGLDAGADDYLTKPFHLRELSARIRAIIRRAAGIPVNVLKLGNLLLEPDAYRVTAGGEELHLQPKEFALLEFFMRHPNHPFTGEALIERIWASDSEATPGTVKTLMYTLRKKISGKVSRLLIQTVHGIGYKLVADADVESE